MTPELEALYQEVLLDHARRPRNFGEIGADALHIHGDNPSCGDEIDLHVRFAPDGRVDALKFTGHGCAISQASASLMTLKLQGKSRDEAMALMRAFSKLVTGDTADQSNELGDLQVMSGVRKFPQRVKCAMLAWRAFEQAVSENAGSAPISTE